MEMVFSIVVFSLVEKIIFNGSVFTVKLITTGTFRSLDLITLDSVLFLGTINLYFRGVLLLEEENASL